MTDEKTRLRRKLTRSFRTLFGDALPADVTTATMDTVEGWDSMATWNLVMLTEEDTGIRISLSEIPRMNSFVAIEAYLLGRLDLAG